MADLIGNKGFLTVPGLDYTPTGNTRFGAGTIQDFGDEVMGALTGFTPTQLDQMRSGEMTVDAYGRPVMKDGTAVKPAGQPNPMSIGEFGTGTFIPAKDDAVGAFSDIFQKKTMRWLNDRNARLRPRAEIAKMRREKYLPDGYDKMSGPEIQSVRDGYDQEISDLVDSRVGSSNWKAIDEEITAVDNKLSWASDPDFEEYMVRESGGTVFDLDETLDFPELFKEIPELRKTRVFPDDSMQPEELGAYTPSTSFINLNRVGQNPRLANEDGIRLDVLMHEVGHDIQKKSGWVPGASPSNSAVRELAKKNRQRLVTKEKFRDKAWRDQNNRIEEVGEGWETDPKFMELESNWKQLNKDMDELGLNDTPQKVYQNQLGEQQSDAVGETIEQAMLNPDDAKAIFDATDKDPYASLKHASGRMHPEAGRNDQAILPKPNMLNTGGTVQGMTHQQIWDNYVKNFRARNK